MIARDRYWEPTRLRLREVTAEHGREMLRWAQAVGLAANFPYHPHELRGLSMETLRILARLCPSWIHLEVVGMSRPELVRFIQGDQPQKPLPPWPAPYRMEDIPTGEEIRPPRR